MKKRKNSCLEFLSNKNLLNSKRSQSGIITTVLIIILVFAAVVIVWNVVKSTIETNTQNILIDQFAIDLEITSVYISGDNQAAYVSIRRGAGDGDISALDFLFTGSSYIYRYPLESGIPSELGSKVYNITAYAVRLQNPDFDNFSSIKSVGVAFEIASSRSGKTITTPIKSEFKGDLRSNTELPNQPNIVPPYIEAGGCTDGEIRQCGITETGPCQFGNETCSGGIWEGICIGSINPIAETCNNIDDNCNTAIDDGVTRQCGNDTGECEFGTETCSAGVWQGICVGSIGPVTESLASGNCGDLKDNDCDSLTDTDFECSVSNDSIYGAKFYDISEYLIGRILIKIFFVESNGSMDTNYENWTSAERNIVLNAITNATNWIVSKYPYNHQGDKLSFIIESETIGVSYEPIDRAAGPFGNPNGGGNESVWVREIMNQKGYNSYGNMYHNVADYLNGQRKAKNTHWAIAIFAVDTSNATRSIPNYAFKNGQIYFASGTGGPYIVIRNYPIDENTISHELLHTFYAMDQYNQPMYNLSSRQGYLNGQNLNYLGAECGGDVMFNLTLNLCNSTKKILGWFDSDSDDIPDILDIEANSILNSYSPDPTTDNTPTYTGSVSTVPFPNQNSHSMYSPLHLTTGEPSENQNYTFYNWTTNNISITTIVNAQYLVRNGGTTIINWTNALASDGSFDGVSENFLFTTAPLSSGTYTIEVRTINSVGIIETSYASDTLTIT